jgi:hypothetical protein
MPAITFVSEQDGAPERDLKQRLNSYFERELAVTTAYLVQVKYQEPSTQQVALCLCADSAFHQSVVESVSRIFSELFNRETHLDILFLQPDTEKQVRMVAKAFYIQPRHET